ncbi:MAG: formylglycine-generating enzyme family protein [Nitrospirae bacterium]|nr:formylglycine-generating enzyme family protein [Nitrospirota bacterium]MDE3218359.1 formylglycine-generating enzyme family protein [Nitrospirota bacterium]
MLETKFKVAFLLAVLALAALPIIGIIRGTTLTPFEESPGTSQDSAPTEPLDPSQDSHEEPVREEMVSIPAGPFIRGTDHGGFDEQPQRTLVLDTFAIDRYEVTNFQYQQFVEATGHRKSGPPSRYAKNMSKMRGINQPVVYVSWEDAEAYCRWKGKRLPTEAEWEKAMRGTDGRLWPWGNVEQPNGANWARVRDGHDVTASVGSVLTDKSPYGVMDGAGNVMEWVADWYAESYFKEAPEENPQSPEYGTFRVLRGGGYATTGGDIRITSRSKMVPDFRDETIGFRCAVSGMK